MLSLSLYLEIQGVLPYLQTIIDVTTSLKVLSYVVEASHLPHSLQNSDP